jgi:hypothetical protein
VLASDVWGRIEAPLDQTIGRWVHVAATRGEDGKKRLYIDGVEVASDGGPREPLGTGEHPLTIGGHINPKNPGKITQRLHGAVDELALFSRTLSASEIAALAGDEDRARLAHQLAK